MATEPTPNQNPVRTRGKLPIWIVIAVAVFVMVGGVGLAWILSGGVDNLARSVTRSSSSSPNTKPTPSEVPVAKALPVDTPPPRAIPADPNKIPVAPTAPPVAAATAPPTAVDFDPNASEAAGVRNEVLKRIDLMPNLAAEDKDKLYAQVDRARGMGLLIQIPFGSGQSSLSSPDIEKLKQATKGESVRKLTEDPTVVFVVLGYADTKGSETANYRVSLARAENALDVLREKCGFQNVMHAVAMGGSDFFDAKQAEKNRLAEVWAVLP